MAENSIKVVTTKKKMTETACTSLMNVTPKNHFMMPRMQLKQN